MRIPAFFLACSIVPAVLHAHVNGTPAGYAGAPSDHNGATCANCHTGGPPVNSAGRFSLSVSNFSPGVQQNISVQINDTQGRLFAFQLTARLASDPTKPGGTFSPTPGQTQVLCANGQTAPCGSGVQYVTNLPAAAQPLTPGTRTFTIIWNPPGRDVGAVLFYVSAIAANNDGTATGDHLYGASGQQASAAPCSLTGIPAFNSQRAVEDAAAFRNTIASNGLITLNGSGFFAAGAPPYVANLSDLDNNGNWPTELGCVSVMVNETPAPIYYVSAHQINAQAISFPNSEGAGVQVILNPGTANQIKGPVYVVPAVPLSPELFTFGPAGTGNAAAFNVTKNGYLADTSEVPSGVSAAPGDIIELFGTGFGGTNPSYLPGQFALTQAPIVSSFSITIGGVKVPSGNISYIGLAPDPTRQGNAPGLYTIVMRLPSVPDGDQPVTVTVGNSSTQSGVTIPVRR